MAVQREARAAWTECRRMAGACLALDLARRRMNVAASWLHLPPTSMARTTNLHRRDWRSSGYVRSLLRRAVWMAAPRYVPPCRRGCPSRVNGETNVVSIANWAPPHRFKPLAMTSIRLSSWRRRCSRLRSATRVLVVTRAPASQQMVAAARSKGTPRPRKIPACGHAARWSPKGSRVRRHRHWRADKGRGSRNRRRRRRRKRCEKYVVLAL